MVAQYSTLWQTLSRLTAMDQTISVQNNVASVSVNDILEWKNDGRC